VGFKCPEVTLTNPFNAKNNLSTIKDTPLISSGVNKPLPGEIPGEEK